LVEQRTENPRVGGSIPPLATTRIRAGFYLSIKVVCMTNTIPESFSERADRAIA
jgi:hypothetical protein